MIQIKNLEKSTLMNSNGEFEVIGIENKEEQICEFCKKNIPVGKGESQGGYYDNGLILHWMCKKLHN